MIKTELERRPLLLIVLGLILGISVQTFPLNLAFLLIVPVLLPFRRWLMFTAAVAVGLVISPGSPPQFISNQSFVDSNWRVSSLPNLEAYGQSCVVSRNGQRMKLVYLSEKPLCPGSTIHITSAAKPPGEGSEKFFRSERLIGSITASASQARFVSDGPWLQQLGLAWRNRFVQLARAELGKTSGDEAAALVFNATSLLSDDTMTSLKVTGTAHIVSASGLHILVISFGLFWLLSWLPVPRWGQMAIALTILGLYAVATGLDPPVIRSIIMAACSNAAWMVRREPDWPSGLSLGAIVCLLANPAAVFTISFQLSFLVVLVLGLFGWRKIEAGRDWHGRTLAAIRTAVIAWVAILPMSAYYFEFIAPASVMANLLILAATVPIVWGGIAAVPIASVFPVLGSLTMFLMRPYIMYIDWIVGTLGGAATIDVPAFSGYWLVLIYGLAISLWRPQVRPAS